MIRLSTRLNTGLSKKGGSNAEQDEHRRVEEAVETRIYPLKSLQVVDFPDIRLNNKGAKTPNSGQNEANED